MKLFLCSHRVVHWNWVSGSTISLLISHQSSLRTTIKAFKMRNLVSKGTSCLFPFTSYRCFSCKNTSTTMLEAKQKTSFDRIWKIKWFCNCIKNTIAFIFTLIELVEKHFFVKIIIFCITINIKNLFEWISYS